MLFNKAAVQPSAEAGESADKKRANVKKIFAYSATIICWIRGFCHGFFPFLHRLYFSICCKNPPRATFCHFCSHFALSLLDKTLTPVKG